MPFVSKYRFELSDDERSAQLEEGARVAEELMRLSARDGDDLRDTPRTILARMNWDIHTWTRDNPVPDREALAMLGVYFPNHAINTLLALLMAENVGLGTLVQQLIGDFKRDALDRAKAARLSPAARAKIRDATITFGHALHPVWETLATPEAQANVGVKASDETERGPYVPPDISNLQPDDYVPIGWIWPKGTRRAITQATTEKRTRKKVRSDKEWLPGTLLVHVGDCLIYPEARFGQSDRDAKRPRTRAQNPHTRA